MHYIFFLFFRNSNVRSFERVRRKVVSADDDDVDDGESDDQSDPSEFDEESDSDDDVTVPEKRRKRSTGSVSRDSGVEASQEEDEEDMEVDSDGSEDTTGALVLGSRDNHVSIFYCGLNIFLMNIRYCCVIFSGRTEVEGKPGRESPNRVSAKTTRNTQPSPTRLRKQ